MKRLVTLLVTPARQGIDVHGVFWAVQDMIWWALYQAEGVLEGSWLRKKAFEEAMAQMHYEVNPSLGFSEGKTHYEGTPSLGLSEDEMYYGVTLV